MKRFKKLLVLITVLVLAAVLCSCGGNSEGSAGDEKKAEEKVYHVGDTWEVEGQWKFTIDSVSVTDERNEFVDEDPAQVIVVNYHYENIGYEDESGLMNGLYLDISSGQLVDSAGNVCSEYPLGSVDAMPQETPIGAKCSAQTAIGLKAAGSPVKVVLSEYDGGYDEHNATFELEF